MESVTLAMRFVLCYSMLALLLTVIAVAALAALYQFIRGQIRAIQMGPFPQHKSPLPFVTTEDWKAP